MTAAPEVGSAERVWSPFQQAVFDFVEDPTGRHAVVSSVPGSGKTTTLVEALYHTKQSERVFVGAFAKPIATELEKRVPKGGGVEVATWHAFGLKAVTAKLGWKEVKDYVPELTRGIFGKEWKYREARTACENLVSRAKCLPRMLAASELDALADLAGISLPKDFNRFSICRAAEKILEVSAKAEGRTINFDDMTWLPVIRNLPVKPYHWVFVDETQDLNPVQIELAIKAAKGGRIVAFGDPQQSIFQFRGADSQAIPNMITRLEAKVLPLSITYRCPRAVVDLAKRIVPAIEAAPGAPEGTVSHVSEKELDTDVRPGDFVISRTNAPLLSWCWRWIKAGRRAEIKGRDIGAGLASWIKGTKAESTSDLVAVVRSWARQETARLVEADRDTTAVEDKAACIESLCESTERVSEVLDKIDRIFGEGTGDGDGIILTSTHRAKGLEADRVWVLRDTFCKWEGEEESNLLYVAMTRSKRELYLVRGEE